MKDYMFKVYKTETIKDNELFICLSNEQFAYVDDKNELIMNTKLTKKCANAIKEAHGKVIDTEPCDKCKEIMKQGVMLIKVRDDDPDYRLGNICVLRDEAIRRIFKMDDAIHLLEMRAGFIAESLWNNIGLPNGEE